MPRPLVLPEQLEMMHKYILFARNIAELQLHLLETSGNDGQPHAPRGDVAPAAAFRVAALEPGQTPVRAAGLRLVQAVPRKPRDPCGRRSPTPPVHP